MSIFDLARLRAARAKKPEDRLKDAMAAFTQQVRGEDLETAAKQAGYLEVITRMIPALKLKFGIQ
ncbi:MAG: hypothetical protein AABY09_01520 [Nanoarchaeota archaeon]